LIATSLGIAVAVPAVLIYNLLIRRVKAGVHSMNDFAHGFYNLCQQAGFQCHAGSAASDISPDRATGNDFVRAVPELQSLSGRQMGKNRSM
jgi:hypothetical protein